MTSLSPEMKLIAIATKQCNNDVVSSVNSKLSYSKCCTYENFENVCLKNVLFSQIMKDKSLDKCNTDFKNDTVVVELCFHVINIML
jgi:hypothetical protein